MPWPATREELFALQRRLARQEPPPWTLPAAPAIGGCFVCFVRRGASGPGEPGDAGWAAAAVLRDGTLLGAVGVTGEAPAGYEAGLLALREGPLLDAAVRALRVRPDVLLVDATGRDHPRRAGLGLHLGAELDLPTVGVTHRPLLATGPWPADEAGARHGRSCRHGCGSRLAHAGAAAPRPRAFPQRPG
jgi:deoxyribonuclease V